MQVKIGNHVVGEDNPTYFIADISANHDGDLERAKLLIRLAKEAGADAAKFQNFRAAKIVSNYGFTAMKGQISHQATWKKSVFQVYADASIPFDWTPALKEECDKVGIDYFSSPYDFEAVDYLDPFVPAHKIGSGDVDWLEMLEYIARKGKPVIVSSGAADIGEVQQAVHTLLAFNQQIVLLQCNTNYTASPVNFEHINLRVLTTYSTMFPQVVLGLSDHTHGHAAVLGAVALGARVIEKHFTDDTSRVGPDHPFSMTPQTWRDMVDRTRELENALGSADKFITTNEKDTSIVQRRCVRAARDIKAGELITREMLDVLRPATISAIKPAEVAHVVGTRALKELPFGKEIRWTDLGE